MKQKRIAAFALALMIVLGFPPKSGAKDEPAENVLRLHILAASDSEADQAVKLLVRDALLELMPACESESEAEAWVLANGKRLMATAERVLAENGFSYGAQLMLGNYVFPERHYGDKVYPAGTYRALRVLLGGGGGQNWWCVLFPPLCIVTKDAEPLPDADKIEFYSVIARWIRQWKEKHTK